ncbi:MAG: S8 family serine peptidase [Candidatus Marinimicrobia bacterium]|nr:S8 family serine peptidase [Candidatus Neomarinimicrobiota bacterium]
MKKHIFISLLLMASLVYAGSPKKSVYYGDRLLICLQPDIMIDKVDVRSGVPVTGISSLDKLISLREIVLMEQYLPGSTPDDMDGDIILSNIYRLRVGSGRSDLEQLVADFSADPSVLYAEKEVIYRLHYSPNDPRFSNQWYLAKVDAPEAWDLFDIAGGVLPGDRAIVMASVDSGVQYTHPDLRDRIWINQAEIPVDIFDAVDANSNGIVTAEEVAAYVIDYDGNRTVDLQDALHSSSPFMDGLDADDWDNNPSSYVDDLFGYDVAGATSGVDPDNDPMGAISGPADLANKMHGTHVGGLLCAATDNGIGTASAMFNGTLMCVKMLVDDGDGGLSNSQTGVLYAAKAGADILNLSWGGGGYSSSDQAVYNLIYNTYGALVVSSAGNGNPDGSPSDSPAYPSGYDHVVSVTALGSSDNFSWANYGVESGTPGSFGYFSGVSISAPGENILSTVYTTAGSYQSWNGTSMASPLVASCFGLLKSAYPEASIDWLVDNILSSADSIDHINPSYAGQLGTGRVNIFNSIGRLHYPQLSYNSYSLTLTNDHGDGLLSPGESALMRINLFNSAGWSDALSVTGILRSRSEYVMITDSTGSYGESINSGNIGVNIIDRYGFSVAENSPSGPLPLELIVTANDGSDYPYTETLEFSVDVSIWQTNFPIASSMIKGGNAVVDLDGDGGKEIIYTAYDSLLHAIDTSGNEIPGFPVMLNYLAEATPAVGDIDNDGDLEVVVGGLDLNLYVVQHDGTAESIHVAPGFLFAPASLYDFDGDGDLEIVSVSYNGELAVMHHDGTMLSNFPMTLDGNMTVGAAIGDIDADGNPNIIVGTWGDHLHAINLDGTEAAGFPVALADHVRSAPLLANLDGSADGSLEIVFGCNDNKLHAYDAGGNELWYVSSSSQDIQADPSIADMDGDGDLEIFFGGLDRLIYAVDHTGTYLNGWPVATGGSIYSSPALVDINNDGSAEVFIGSNDRNLYGLNLDGSSIGGFPVNGSGNIQGSPSVADLDGDGDLEIIVGSDNKLMVMDLPTSGETASYWATHRGNLHRTGVLPTLVPVVDRAELPTRHRLYTNYPNPFNPSTLIGFDIAEDSYVTLQILDIRGRVVDELISSRITAGSYSVSWQGKIQGKPADAGIYFYRLSTQQGNLVRKMTLLK